MRRWQGCRTGAKACDTGGTVMEADLSEVFSEKRNCERLCPRGAFSCSPRRLRFAYALCGRQIITQGRLADGGYLRRISRTAGATVVRFTLPLTSPTLSIAVLVLCVTHYGRRAIMRAV